MTRKFAFETPDEALQALAARLTVVETEKSLDADSCVGRVLVEDIVADRDSPAADVSAMDGYAIRLTDLLNPEPLAVRGESVPGGPPPEMPSGAAVRIFTGAIVPEHCEAVVKREDTEELDGAIRFHEAAINTQLGEHIRRAGENAPQGSQVVSAGTRVTAAQRATMENFGCLSADVYQPIKVAIITTGDEVGTFVNQSPQPWQLRNSNRASLAALVSQLAAEISIDHCRDDRGALTDLLSDRLQAADAILLTGGVSMGDYDYVPDVVQDVGGQIVFHGLPIRPGKPILGAATAAGKLLLGLPGNPVSATVGCRRMALPLLSKMSGQTDWLPLCPVVQLQDAGDQKIPLRWLRLVRMTGHGVAQCVISKGSGDLVSLGQSSGFVEIPAGKSDESAWPYYAWRT